MEITRIGYQPAPAPAPVQGGLDAPAPVDVQSVAAAPVSPTPQNAGYERLERDIDILQRAVDTLDAAVSGYNRHLSVRMHEATGRRVITVYDSASNEVVREIPPESVLNAHASMLELAGLLVDTRG